MTPAEWATIKNFTNTENWGDQLKIKYCLVKELDLYREYISKPILISCGTQGKHTANSLHYEGLAVDIVFPWMNSQRELLDCLMQCFRFRFKGVGVYGHWKHRGLEIGGLHLDMRPSETLATWVGYSDGTYHPLTKGALQDIGIL